MLVVALNAISLATQIAHTLSLTFAVCLWKLPTSFCATGETSIVHEEARLRLARPHECSHLPPILNLRTRQEVCHRRSSAYASVPNRHFPIRQPNRDQISNNLPSVGDSKSPFLGVTLSPILQGACSPVGALLPAVAPAFPNEPIVLPGTRLPPPGCMINHLLLLGSQ